MKLNNLSLLAGLVVAQQAAAVEPPEAQDVEYGVEHYAYEVFGKAKQAKTDQAETDIDPIKWDVTEKARKRLGEMGITLDKDPVNPKILHLVNGKNVELYPLDEAKEGIVQIEVKGNGEWTLDLYTRDNSVHTLVYVNDWIVSEDFPDFEAKKGECTL